MIKRLYQALLYSLQGISAAYKNEFAFRLEIGITLLALPLSIFIGQTWLARCALFAVWLLVPLIELINSAIENAVDLIGQENDEFAKRAKDMGSAAVLIAIVMVIIVWVGYSLRACLP